MLKYVPDHSEITKARGIFVAAHGLISSCGVQVFSSCGAGSRACGLCSLQHAGSLVVTRGLIYPAACGILIPQPGIEPVSPALEGGFFTTGPPGKSLLFAHS